MLRPLALILCALSLAACSTSGTTTPTGDSTAAKFKAADLNGDGRLDRAEFTSAYAEARFRFFDVNGDGFIDQKEWERVSGDDRAAAFEKINRSKSGKISLAEWKASPEAQKRRNAVFTAMDKNKNGKLSLEEVRAALEAREKIKP